VSGATKEERGDIFGESVEVEDDRFVLGEEAVKGVGREGVRVGTDLAKDHLEKVGLSL
jgi:predicted solute-binding protein